MLGCLRGCVCGGRKSLKEIIAAKDVKTMKRLVKAVRSKDLADALMHAAQHGSANVSTKGGSRPLHEAVKAASLGTAQQLIAAGASLDAQDFQDETPMEIAKSLGDKRMVQLLMKESSKKKTNQFVEGMSLLQKVSLFSNLEPSEYPRLAAAFTTRCYTAGETVIRQGDPGHELFIIHRGSAQVLVATRGEEKQTMVNVLHAADWFGEAALLHQTPRNATIVATNNLVVKVISRKDFQCLDLRSKLHFTKRKAVRQADDAPRETETGLLIKTPAQVALVKKAMLANPNLGSLLRHLSAKDIDQIVSRAFRMDVQKSVEVVKQGQMKADLFFVVEEGLLQVVKNGVKVGECGPGGSFGELAMLFRSPRAATVTATTRSLLWALPRQDLRLVMQARVKQKIEGFAVMLSRLDIMKNVAEDDRKVLADAMVEQTFHKDEFIITQGEEGQTFYILFQGEVAVEVRGKQVAKYASEPTTGKHASFGERALEKDEPRAASIKVLSDKAVVLGLDREMFLAIRGLSKRSEAERTPALIEYNREQLEPIGLLGNGGFGSVSLVKCHATGKTFALKTLSKGHIIQQVQDKSVMNEKGILRMTNSPFIIRLAATFNGEDHLHFLLEACMGGELFTVYQRKNLYGSEKHGRFYVACVLRAFEHLHTRQIIYRDLKPENLLLDNSGYCKLTDFGLAKFVIGHTYTTCGTPDYFAPEMVMGLGHTLAVDWWTLGILTYELLMADTPFSSEDAIYTFRKVQCGIEAVSFPGAASWPSLVRGLCKQEPSERLPMRKGGSRCIEEHEWFREGNFNWKALDARQMIAPYIPTVRSPQDLANFEADSLDAPPEVPYMDPGTGWDRDFEDRVGPAFD